MARQLRPWAVGARGRRVRPKPWKATASGLAWPPRGARGRRALNVRMVPVQRRPTRLGRGPRATGGPKPALPNGLRPTGRTIHDDGWIVTSQTGVRIVPAGGPLGGVGPRHGRFLALGQARRPLHVLGSTISPGLNSHAKPATCCSCSSKRPTGWLSGAVRVADGSGTVEGDSLGLAKRCEAHGRPVGQRRPPDGGPRSQAWSSTFRQP